MSGYRERPKNVLGTAGWHIEALMDRDYGNRLEKLLDPGLLGDQRFLRHLYVAQG
jgi:hypothetical protein